MVITASTVGVGLAVGLIVGLDAGLGESEPVIETDGVIEVAPADIVGLVLVKLTVGVGVSP